MVNFTIKNLFYCITILGLFWNICQSRQIKADEDICRRHPNFRALCPQSSQDANNVLTPPPAPIINLEQSTNVPPAPPVAPEAPAPLEKQNLDKQTYCNQYIQHYTYFCLDRTSIPSKSETFCQSFGANCPEIIQAANGVNYSDPTVLQQCRQNQGLANAYCKDEGGEDKLYRSKCDTWRKYCKDNPFLALAATDPQVAQICNSYRVTADQFCPGYETIQYRQYCNYYRVYCQGKKPFPNIDGSIGVVAKNWGVGGIPYYPFNREGVVAGGDKVDVGFGDWGADVNRRTGVTDFYEQSKQVDANWQRGTFGGGDSWNVPVVGIGGYNRAGVSLGGIANPSDFPGLFSGGVQQTPPLSGLGQIPLTQGLPAPLSAAPSADLVESLRQPVGGGNLGLLGALGRGAPISAGPGMLGSLGQSSGLGRLGQSGLGSFGGGGFGRRRKRRQAKLSRIDGPLLLLSRQQLCLSLIC